VPSRLELGLTAGVATLLALWGWFFVAAYRERGLFNWLGFDYGYFWAVTTAGLRWGWPAMYDPGAIAAQSEALTAYYGPGPGRPLTVAPPWLPAYFLLFVPLAPLPPPVGYVLWTLANLALAVAVVDGLARRCPAYARLSWRLTAAAVTFFPLGNALFFGQPSVLWLLAMARAERAFATGREGRAGLWVGLLLLKPQYALFLVLVLLLKGRRAASAGVAAVGVALLLVSGLMVGPAGLGAYLDAVRALGRFRLAESLIAPQLMISWRGLLLNTLPAEVGDAWGAALSLALSALTAGVLVAVWRGPWAPRSPRFPVQLLATTLVTMLAAFHNHSHGATLVLAPALAVAAQGVTSASRARGGNGPSRRLGRRLLLGLLLAGLLVPTLVFFGTQDGALLVWIFVDLAVGGLLACLLVLHGEPAEPAAPVRPA
jgi:Glycosyltransferase family 87